MAFQNIEKQKRADELAIANKELIFQNIEKQKRADECIIANAELLFQNKEKEKRANELIKMNETLDLQFHEISELTKELKLTNKELTQSEEYLRNYINGLEELIFMTSHQVRQPITHILGISNLLEIEIDYSQDELKNILRYLKKSALVLDDFTKELTNHMSTVSKKFIV